MAYRDRSGGSGLLTRVVQTYAEIVEDVAEHWSSSLRHIRQDEKYGVDTAVRDAAGFLTVAGDALDSLWDISRSDGGVDSGPVTLTFFVTRGANTYGTEIDENTPRHTIPFRARRNDPAPEATDLAPVRGGGSPIERERVFLKVTDKHLEISLQNLKDSTATLTDGGEYAGWVLLKRPNDFAAIARLHVLVV